MMVLANTSQPQKFKRDKWGTIKIQKQKAGTSINYEIGGLELTAKFTNHRCVFANLSATWYNLLRNASKLSTW